MAVTHHYPLIKTELIFLSHLHNSGVSPDSVSHLTVYLPTTMDQALYLLKVNTTFVKAFFLWFC